MKKEKQGNVKREIGIAGLILFSFFYFLFSPSATAAQPRVYLERVGNFGVRVLVDSAGAPLNAYDIHITYDAAIAEIEKIDTSRSLITVMPQPVKASGGEISIKGGSTSAFSGNTGELVSIAMKPISQGVVQFAVTKAAAYQADGAGTAVTLDAGTLALRVTAGSFASYEQSKQVAVAGDSVPPEITTAVVEENPLNYGERLLVFQAVDPESGVARYEARDRTWLAWSAWRQAQNPYSVDSSAWAIQLKAIDNNGNEALATVYQLGNAIGKVAGFVAILVIVMLWWSAFQKRKKHA